MLNPYGKNPFNHSDKIYIILGHHLAAKVYVGIAGVRKVSVWLCSRIGQPTDPPVLVPAAVKTKPGVHVGEFNKMIAANWLISAVSWNGCKEGRFRFID